MASGASANPQLTDPPTDGIDFLDPSGVCVAFPGWVPKIAVLKGGGVRVSSQTLDAEHVVAGAYGNVIEEIPVYIDDNAVAERAEELMRFLWNAEAWARTDWQKGSVYIAVRLEEEAELRYARVVAGAFQFGAYSYGDRAGFPNNVLVLEREPFWHSRPPGTGMMGPFSNAIKNPSFEWWTDKGIDSEHTSAYDLTPDGWRESVENDFPLGREIRREEYQKAGDDYALDLNYTGDCGPDYMIFNGTTSRANLGSDASIDNIPNGDMTADAWIRADGYGESNSGQIFNKQFWFFRVDNTNGLLVCAVCTGVNATSQASLADFSADSQWHHVAAVWDNGTLTWQLFVDGIEVTYAQQQAGGVGYSGDAANFMIVGNNVGQTNTFDGDIQWARVSNTKLWTSNFTPPVRCAHPTVVASTVGLWVWNLVGQFGAYVEDLTANGNDDEIPDDITSARDCVCATNQEWYLWQEVSLQPSADYTLRFWSYIEHGGGTEQFFVRVVNSQGFLFAQRAFSADKDGGWSHVSFTTTWRAWPTVQVQIGWNTGGSPQPARVVIDRMVLTQGVWSLESWPGDFYLTSSLLWNHWENEAFIPGVSGNFPLNGMHEINFLDIDSVPGDVPAETVLSLDNWSDNAEITSQAQPIITLALFKETRQISNDLRRIPTGSQYSTLGDPRLLLGNSLIAYGLSDSETWEIVYSFQLNGSQVTQLIDGQYRVLARVSNAHTLTGSSHTKTFRLSTWIGEPENVVQYDEVAVSCESNDGRFVMLNLTPRRALNWVSPQGGEVPSALGLYVEAMTDDPAETHVYFSALLVGCVSDGGVLASCEPPIHAGQSLVMDTRRLAVPVARSTMQVPATQDPYVFGISFADAPPDKILACAREYNGTLFVGGSNELLNNSMFRYTPSDGWAEDEQYSGVNTSRVVIDFEVFNGLLYFLADGSIYNYNSSTGTYTLNYFGSVTGRYMQAFDGYLWIALSDNKIYRWLGDPPAAAPSAPASVYTCAEDPQCMAVYKHQLWIGAENRATYVYDENGWTVGPIVPDGDATAEVMWMQAFEDRLYAILDNGNVWRWDGDAWAISLTNTPATYGNGYKLSEFNGQLYALLGIPSTFPARVFLFSTEDGVTWNETVGLRPVVSINGLDDAMTMEPYCGRLAFFCSASNDPEAIGFWHAPEVARLTVPQYTGAPVRLVPRISNRITTAWTTEYSDGTEVWEVNQNTRMAAHLKMWIDPQWRSLRSD
jgi:hypothetical protein